MNPLTPIRETLGLGSADPGTNEAMKRVVEDILLDMDDPHSPPSFVKVADAIVTALRPHIEAHVAAALGQQRELNARLCDWSFDETIYFEGAYLLVCASCADKIRHCTIRTESPPMPDQISRAEHIERLEAMLDDDVQTWDLSDNDRAALKWAVERIAQLEREALYVLNWAADKNACIAELEQQVRLRDAELYRLRRQG